jgi:hypothetical protein
VADGIDASMKAMKAGQTEAVLDRLPIHLELEQLAVRHDAVLTAGQRRQREIVRRRSG